MKIRLFKRNKFGIVKNIYVESVGHKNKTHIDKDLENRIGY